MTIARANRREIKLLLEDDFNVTPSSSLELFGVTNFDGTCDDNTQKDERVTGDGQLVDLQEVSRVASADMEFEARYCDVFHDIVQAAMRASAWVTVAISDTDIAFNATDNALSSTSTNFVDNNCSVGIIVDIGGSTDTDNVGRAKVTAVAVNKLTLSSDWLDVDDKGPGATVTVDCIYCRNGNTVESFSIEEETTDVASNFIAYTGMTVNSLELAAEIGNKWTGRVNFMGADQDRKATTIGTGADTAAAVNLAFDSNAHVQKIYIDDSAIGIGLRSLRFMINNSIEMDEPLTSAVPTGAGFATDFSGIFDVEAFFQDGTQWDLWEAKTAQAIDFEIKDAAGNYYWISLMRAKANTRPKFVAGGKTGKCTIQCQLEGTKKQSAPLFVAQVCRVAA